MHSCGHLFHKLISLIWIRTSYQNFKLIEEHDSCICWVFVCKTYLLLQDFLTKIFPFLEKYDTKNISIGNPNIILQESATCAYLFRRRHDITCCLPGSVGLPTQGTLLWVIVALGRKVISFFFRRTLLLKKVFFSNSISWSSSSLLFSPSLVYLKRSDNCLAIILIILAWPTIVSIESPNAHQ